MWPDHPREGGAPTLPCLPLPAPLPTTTRCSPGPSNPSPPFALCTAIAERQYTVAEGQKYHLACFACSECGRAILVRRLCPVSSAISSFSSTISSFPSSSSNRSTLHSSKFYRAVTTAVKLVLTVYRRTKTTVCGPAAWRCTPAVSVALAAALFWSTPTASLIRRIRTRHVLQLR